jgi:hypothetical protein
MTETRELTAREELEEIAEVLREADVQEKAAAELKKEVRGPFFELISEIVREEVTLSRETLVVAADENFDARQWQALNYPLYRVVALGQGPEEGTLAITIEENDEFKKFEFTAGGFKFGRTVKMAGKGFEADAFVTALENGAFEVEPEVLERLQKCINKEIVTVYSANEAEMSSVMADHPEAVAIFQEFINPGTPQVALLPIKAIKESDEA